MEILKYPHPDLLHATPEVKVFGAELRLLLALMYDTMCEHHGVGLAANQVGLGHAMFVMTGPDNQRLNIVNPKITKRSEAQAHLKEGCLSAPGEFVVLEERAKWVEIEFQDGFGNPHKKVFHDIYAVCVQHEMDHLLGKSHLMSKSIPRAKRKQLAKKYGLELK